MPDAEHTIQSERRKVFSYNGCLCDVDGCQREAKARSLCFMHYQRLKKHGEAGSAETLLPRINTNGLKYCPKCDEDLVLDHFGKDRHARDGLTIQCKKCRNATNKTYRKNNLEATRKTQRKHDLKRREEAKKAIVLHPRKPEKTPEELQVLEEQRRSKRREKNRRSYQRNIAKRHTYDRERRAKNQGERNERERQRRAKKRQEREEQLRQAREENPAFFEELEQVALQRFRKGRQACDQRRRARKHGNTGPLLTRQEWDFIKHMYDNRCVYCGKKPKILTQDHIVPLVKGGQHIITNVVPACRSCNSKKRDRAPLKPVQPLLGFVA